MKEEEVQTENLKYKVRKSSNFENVSEWMQFFLLVGEFLEKKDSINFYISYLDEYFPALFIVKGIIDTNFKKIKADIKDYDINSDLKIGDKVTYLSETKNGEGIWKKAEVVNIYNDETVLKKEWNPYIELKFEIREKETLNHKIPRTLWKERLRISSNYKNTAGNVVKMNKEIQGYIRDKYSNEVVNYLQATNKLMVNIIGLKTQSIWCEYNEFLQFSENGIEYKIEDFIFANDSQFSISNVNFIKRSNSNYEVEENIPSIFVGDNSALTLGNVKTKKNVILSNRKKDNDTIEELVKQNVLNDSIFNNKKTNSSEFLTFINEKNVDIPKGAEIFVY
ncbi:hypothetical protein [Staphylococcus kloosii]|jgi:hypothetical protein|uniref:hypothetical protein n=1 Tax=Staphylococcus kloosii TaxID=29384 RepID=UPI00189FC65A|nr:hypothetical protein [Staphylococcus kloosii]MBF7030175.1 hypothetical protein [Staphylococcus kloosii]